jgi:hypothetical protein
MLPDYNETISVQTLPLCARACARTRARVCVEGGGGGTGGGGGGEGGEEKVKKQSGRRNISALLDRPYF